MRYRKESALLAKNYGIDGSLVKLALLSAVARVLMTSSGALLRIFKKITLKSSYFNFS